MRPERGGGGFTRGWETLAHDLAMLRAAARRHLVVSLLAGVVLGSVLFLHALRPATKEDLGGYAEAVLRAEVHPSSSTRAAAAEEVPEWRAYFGDRSLEFLAWQAFGRMASVGSVVFLAGGALVAVHGRRLRREHQRRGVVLHDVAAERRAKERRMVFGLVAFAAVLVLLFEGLRLRGPALDALPDYLTAAAAMTWAPVARALSPDGAGLVGWFQDAVAPGLYRFEAVYAFLLPRYGLPVGNLLRLALSKWLVAAGLLFLARLALRLLDEKREAAEGGYRIAGVPMPVEQECCHFLITGSPGSGKSTAIKDLLDQVRARGQRAIVYDRSGEYVKHYFRAGRDKLLNPLDARSELWTLWGEVREPADYGALARSLFPPGGSEPFWADASAVLFASAAAALDREAGGQMDACRNKGLYNTLTRSRLEDLHELLSDQPAARFLDPQAGAMPSNLIATVTSRLEPWAHLPDPERGKSFSIREFVEGEGSDAWLFLATTEQHGALMKPLLSLWADIAVKAILSLPESARSRLWCVLDEVASLQRLPALPDLLERGRKYGAAVVLGLQALAQLRDAYGRDAAAGLTTQSSTWLVLRSVEPENCQWLENALGHAEVDEARESISMGAEAQRDGVGIQHQTVKRAIVLASEISSLPAREGFLRFAGEPHVYRVAYPHKDRPTLAEAFVSRAQKKSGSASPVRVEPAME